MKEDNRSKIELLQRVKELEKALTKNRVLEESLLGEILSIDNSCIYEWFNNSDILLWDKCMYKYWGVPSNTTMNKKLYYQGIHFEDRKRVKRAIDDLFIEEGNVELNIQFRVIGIESNVERWLKQYGKVVFENGIPLKLVVITKDITDHLQARETLDNLNSNFALHEIILDDKGKPVDYRFLALNPSFEEAIGMTAADVIGKTALELFPETEAYWINKFAEVALTGIATSYENYSVELGKWFDVKLYSPKKGQFALLGIDITEQKMVERKLKESEEKFRTIVENSSDWIWELDVEGNYTYSSPACFNILGYTPEELIGRSTFSLMPPEEAEKVRGESNKYVDEKVPFTFLENINVHKDGHLVMLESSAVPIINADGEYVGYRGIDRDITDRRNKEIAANELKRVYQKLIENSPLGMHFYTLNDEDQLIFEEANPGADKLLGVDSTIFVGKTICEAFPALEQSEVPIKYYSVAKEGTYWTTEQIVYDENRIAGAYKVIAFQTKPGSMVAIFDDITERKKAEQAVIESEKLFRLLADNSTDMIARHDNAGVFKYVSPACRALVGYEPEELIGHSAFDFFHPDDLAKTEENRKKIINQAINSTITFRFRCKNGDYTWLETNTRTIFDRETGNAIELHASSRDVNERILAAQKIKEQNEALKELNASKDKFVAVLAHDLRSPLSSLLSLLEVLQVGVRTFSLDEVEHYISVAYRSAENLSSLLNDILVWASSQVGRIPFNPQQRQLSKTVNEVIEVLKPNASSKNIEIESSLNSDFDVIADIDMLKTILRNLISNAIKFTNIGGTVKINCIHNVNETQISVSDNGVGICEETKAKFFDISSSFSTPGTNQEKGSGLGLLLCKEFVDRHNGKIWVESEVDKGSTFYFTIPKSL